MGTTRITNQTAIERVYQATKSLQDNFPKSMEDGVSPKDLFESRQLEAFGYSYKYIASIMQYLEQQGYYLSQSKVGKGKKKLYLLTNKVFPNQPEPLLYINQTPLIEEEPVKEPTLAEEVGQMVATLNRLVVRVEELESEAAKVKLLRAENVLIREALAKATAEARRAMVEYGK